MRLPIPIWDDDVQPLDGLHVNAPRLRFVLSGLCHRTYQTERCDVTSSDRLGRPGTPPASTSRLTARSMFFPDMMRPARHPSLRARSLMSAPTRPGPPPPRAGW